MEALSINNRTGNFKRNQLLESLLSEINSDLKIAEENLVKKEYKEYPIIFIVGPLRSGSTLFLQWLASTGQFSYPTNMLSRFYGAPIIGAKIQLLLTDEKYNFRNEILDFNSQIDFHSENGKTKGALSPNEFWYFWRRFLPFKEIDYLPNEQLLELADIETFKSELLGIANVFEKPFALKAMICNYNIEFLDKIFDKALFIYTKRNPLTNIESALQARKKQLGSEKEWYSFKIPEYYELKKIKDPIKQTAGQIFYINKAIEAGLRKVKEEKKVIVNYEDFCKNPKQVYSMIYEKLLTQGFHINARYKGPTSFKISRKEPSNDQISKMYNEFIESII